MKILDIKSDEEVLEAVDLYHKISDKLFISISKEESIKNFKKLVSYKKFLKCIKKNNVIIAWIYADIMKPLHMSENVFYQFYYASSETGISAYKCVVMLHNEMIKEASKRKIRYSISQGSFMDEHNTFSRILEKNGWDRRGHTAIFELPQQDARLVRPATFLSR